MRQSRSATGGKSIAIATDLGVYSDYTVQNLTGLDAVLLEANHDENMLAVGPYPYPLKQRIAGAKGHLSNLAAGHLLCEILHDNLQEVLLGHLSKENNYEALAFEPWPARSQRVIIRITRVIFISLSLKEAKYHR